MKLFILIPCLDEDINLGAILQAIPKQFAGVTSIQILVVYDASKDNTLEIAAVSRS